MACSIARWSLARPLRLRVQAGAAEEEQASEQERCFPYLVLSYAERGSLADMFVREGRRPWSLNRVVTIAREIADALDYAHSRGVLHRDVKPANILYMGTHALLSDFSVATLIEADVSHLDAPWAGSPAYMAPEVWQLRPGRYSDQYALAVTCFYLLSSDLPLRKKEGTQSRSWAHLHSFVPPRSILELRRDLPIAIDLVLQRAMAKNPHERYATVTAFAADLATAAQDITQNLVALIDTREIGSPPGKSRGRFIAPIADPRGSRGRFIAPIADLSASKYPTSPTRRAACRTACPRATAAGYRTG